MAKPAKPNRRRPMQSAPRNKPTAQTRTTMRAMVGGPASAVASAARRVTAKPKGPTHGVKGSASSVAARQKMAAGTALRNRRAAAGYDPRVGPPAGSRPKSGSAPKAADLRDYAGNSAGFLGSFFTGGALKPKKKGKP